MTKRNINNMWELTVQNIYSRNQDHGYLNMKVTENLKNNQTTSIYQEKENIHVYDHNTFLSQATKDHHLNLLSSSKNIVS